jgi:pimeloyl-ACP methyl ester carboxylesterase
MGAATRNTGELGVTFTERFVQVGGRRIRYLEAGQGNPVVVLRDGNGFTSYPLDSLLARQFRVIVVEIPDVSRSPENTRSQSRRDLARTLAEVIAALGVEHYGVVSTTVSAPLALWHAIDWPQRIDALVLISPIALIPDGWTTPSGYTRDPALEQQLGDLQTATLVLVGTRDEILPAETGRLYVERLPNCYYALVYDAGHEIEAERPEALCAAARDFLEQRETFVVSRKNTVINP